jgi:hypothetical protein
MRKVLGASSILCFGLAGLVWWIGSSARTFPDWDTAAILSMLLSAGSVLGIWVLNTDDGQYKGDPRWAYGLLMVLFVVLGGVWLALGEWVWRYEVGYYRWYKNEWWVVGFSLGLAAVWFVLWLYSFGRDDPYEALSEMNRYAAAKETKASGARTNLKTQLAQEIQAATKLKESQLDYNYVAPRAKEQRDLEQVRHIFSATQIKEEEKLIKGAGSRGFTLDTDQGLKLEAGKAQIEVAKAEALKAIDSKARWLEIQQDLDAADRYELTAHGLIGKMTEHLFKLQEQYRQIEKEETDEWLKQSKLRRLEKNMNALEGLIDAKQNGLLPTQNGTQTRGLGAAPDGGTGGRQTPQTTQDQPPTEVPRNRTGRGNRY